MYRAHLIIVSSSLFRWLVSLLFVVFCLRPSLPVCSVSVLSQIPAGPAAMRLVHVDFFAVDREVFHVASKGR